jgi:hypothetical protein
VGAPAADRRGELLALVVDATLGRPSPPSATSCERPHLVPRLYLVADCGELTVAAAPPRLAPRPLGLLSFLAIMSCSHRNSPMISASSDASLGCSFLSDIASSLSSPDFDGLFKGYPTGMARKFAQGA